MTGAMVRLEEDREAFETAFKEREHELGGCVSERWRDNRGGVLLVDSRARSSAKTGQPTFRGRWRTYTCFSPPLPHGWLTRRVLQNSSSQKEGNSRKTWQVCSVVSMVRALPRSGCCVAVFENQREHKEYLQEWDSLFRQEFKGSVP